MTIMQLNVLFHSVIIKIVKLLLKDKRVDPNDNNNNYKNVYR